jgi:hypothetical protein
MLPTVVCRCAPGVAVEYESPVTHDTHPIPLCSEINRRGCTREPQSLAMHTASYTGWVFRSTSSSANLRARAKYDGARIRFHATFLPPMLQIQVQEEIVEPTSRNEVRFLRSRHLQLGEADWLICSQAARSTACREPEATKE